MPETAAFPSGLPPALGASVAVHPPSDGSDSEYGMSLRTVPAHVCLIWHVIASEASAKPCTCKSNAECTCWTPRASRKRRQSKSSRKSDKDAPISASEQPHQPAGLVMSAHSKEYRPVLPRPSSGSRASPPHTTHSPTTASHSNRAQLFFSPYGRAYEYAHGAEVGPELTGTSLQQVPQVSQIVPNPTSYPTDRSSIPSYLSDWLSTVQQPSQLPPPPPSVLCDCGPNCACPGCVVHRGASADTQGFASCTNPTTCSACLECAMLSLAENPIVEEWLRGEMPQSTDDVSQASSASPSVPSPPPQSFFNAVNQVVQQTGSEMRFDPQSWQSYALWNNLQGQVAAPSPPEDCCNGQCKCTQGMCSCPSDCCGCCTGCSCANCTHEDRTMGSGKTLTFALSAQRDSCCGRNSPQTVPESQQAGPSSTSRAVLNISQMEYQQAELDLRGIYEWSSSSSDVPRVSLSRASSASSRSSGSHHSLSQHSHYSSSQSSAHRNVAPATTDPAVKSCCASLATLNTSTASTSTSQSPIPPPYIPSPTDIVQERTYQYDPNTDSAGMF